MIFLWKVARKPQINLFILKFQNNYQNMPIFAQRFQIMGTNKFNYKIAPPITNVDLSVSHELRINLIILYNFNIIQVISSDQFYN